MICHEHFKKLKNDILGYQSDSVCLVDVQRDFGMFALPLGILNCFSVIDISVSVYCFRISCTAMMETPHISLGSKKFTLQDL